MPDRGHGSLLIGVKNWGQAFTQSGGVQLFDLARWNIREPGPRDGWVPGVVWFTIWVDGAAAGSKTYTLSEGGRTLATTTTTSSGPVSIPWSTTTGDNGARTPTVGVRDSTGATGTGSVNVTVAN